jgi:hypothetical protein
MRTIDDTPRGQRFLMVTHRLSPSSWENVCMAVRSWLANPPESLSRSEVDRMLATITSPLPETHFAFIIICCYADIPTNTRWDTAFDPSLSDRHEATIAVLQFSVFWSRAVLPSLEHGHHQVAVLAFPNSLPSLLASLPDESDDVVTDYVGLCESEDLSAIRLHLDSVS